jgi:8-oxo-dGTP pyrophosphatase MutT (NUDIX family)
MAASRVRPRRLGRVRSAVAAGGVVMRGADDALEVALAGRRSDGSWVFPKGTPDGDESIEETAVRETQEETGLKVRILEPLGPMEYWFAAAGERVHKFVHFYLMEPVGGDVSLHDHEYDDVRWVPVAEARRMLSFETYREVLDRALAARADGAAS